MYSCFDPLCTNSVMKIVLIVFESSLSQLCYETSANSLRVTSVMQFLSQLCHENSTYSLRVISVMQS